MCGAVGEEEGNGDNRVFHPNWKVPIAKCIECNRRYHLSSRPNLCKRACGTCCERYNCVPSGTSDHYEECPYYANMTTHGGKPKCP
ncbi:hypothetical protein VNO78_28617 [Psophocarpus tetragonolobus]|uniref:Uncharacterized protein n=1 Tax=Psophocarpus tetragonolobus TaxID=3891 RepID=A0AAN9RTK0_PSOTE